jgi:hypothetical protein
MQFDFADLIRIFEAMPGAQLGFLALAAATWLGGANVLVAYHYKRTGKPAWSGFKPFAFPFRQFNAMEWLMLAGLAVLALTFIAIATSLNPQ